MGVYLPPLTEVQTNREMIGVFGGYNHNPRIGNNEFFDMGNMASDHYPLLAPRGQRARVRQFTKPNGLFARDKLCWVDGTTLYYDGQPVGEVEDSPKQFVGMGAYILVWPDKVSYNTHTGAFEHLAHSITTEGEVSVTLCKVDGTDYGDYATSPDAPPDPTNGQLWVDTSATPHVLKMYSTTYGMWTTLATTFVKIAAPGIGAGFAEYDGVSISGLTGDNLNGAFVLYGAGDDYIVVTALIDETFTQGEPVTVERTIPDMDFLTESENRVWGCSSAKHEIYACALGDPKNWNRFMGIATDSYALTVGSSGDFTGCVTHQGYVLFLKEDVLHKLYGNKPSNYQITNTNCRGVQKGSEKSLLIVNETLYYKSRGDVCAYNAALPSSISTALGCVQYRDAVAGARGSRYYISMRDTDGRGVLLVYDETRGQWHREDGVYAAYFAALGSELYFINAQDNCLYAVGGTLGEYADGRAALEGRLSWYAQTGDIGLDSPDNKYISKLQLRLEADAGALVRIEVQYDQEDAWTERYRINVTHKRSFTAPIIPRRCDTMRLRVSGHGDVRIYSLTKTVEQGSEV